MSEQTIELWAIRHPGGDEIVYCGSFEEAMDKWFEGFNIPRKLTATKESFEDAYARVKAHCGKRAP